MSRELLTNLTLATMERGGHPYGLVDGGRGGGGRTGASPGAGRRTRCRTSIRRVAAARSGRPAGHAGADRLPHPPRARRRPGPRVRDAARGDAATRTIARAGGGIFSTVAATRQDGPGRAPRGRPPAGGRADRRRRLRHRDQVGLRPRRRDGARHAAHRAPHRGRAPGPGAHELPRRPRGAPGVRGPRRRLSRRGVPAGPGGRPRAGPGRRGGRLLRGHRLHAGPDRAACSGAPARWGCP